MRTNKIQHCSMKRVVCAHDTAHCPHILTFLTNHVSAWFMNTYILATQLCIQLTFSRNPSSLCLMLCHVLTVNYERNTFIFLPHNKTLTSEQDNVNFLSLQRLFHFFVMVLPYFLHGASVFVAACKLVLFQYFL